MIDSKHYRGRLQFDGSGRLWHGRYPLALALRTVAFEADQAAQVLVDPDVVVVPIVAVHGAQVPWGKVVIDGVPVVAARRLPTMLRALPAVLGPERVAWLADQARVRSTPQLDPYGEPGNSRTYWWPASWGWKPWPQTPQVIGPGVYCVARILNDRGGWQPQATLNR